jgi:hypothetical protein
MSDWLLVGCGCVIGFGCDFVILLGLSLSDKRGFGYRVLLASLVLLQLTIQFSVVLFLPALVLLLVLGVVHYSEMEEYEIFVKRNPGQQFVTNWILRAILEQVMDLVQPFCSWINRLVSARTKLDGTLSLTDGERAELRHLVLQCQEAEIALRRELDSMARATESRLNLETHVSRLNHESVPTGLVPDFVGYIDTCRQHLSNIEDRLKAQKARIAVYAAGLRNLRDRMHVVMNQPSARQVLANTDAALAEAIEATR